MIIQRNERKAGASREMKIHFQFREVAAAFSNEAELYFCDQGEQK